MPISPYFQQQAQGYNPAMMQLQQGYLPGERPDAPQQEPGFWDKLGSGLKEYIFGKSAGLQKVREFEPHQIQALNQLAGQGLNQYQNPYEGFQGLEDETKRQFYQDVVPSLSERFTSLRAQTGGRLSSPAFASQVGAAGAGLQSMLNAQKSQYGMANRGQALNALQLGLAPQFRYAGTPEQEGLWQKGERLAGGVAKAGVKLLSAGAL